MAHLQEDKGWMKQCGYVGVYVLGDVIGQGCNKKNEVSHSWEGNSTSTFYKSDIYYM